MKLGMLSVVYLCYALLPNMSILFTLPTLLYYGVKRNLSVPYYILPFLTYTIVLFFISLVTGEYRYTYNLLSSSKFLFFLCLLVFFINSSNIYYDRISKLELSYRVFAYMYLTFGITCYILFPHARAFGMRGDVGIFSIIIVLPSLYMFCLNVNAKKLYTASILLLLLSLFLFLLGGRTSFFVLIIALILVSRIAKTVRGKNHSAIKIFNTSMIAIIIAVAVLTWSSRGGLEDFQTSEARVLALLYWLDVVSNTSAINLFFGHGYGYCANLISLGPDLARQHISQIMASSAGDCYVSWGFHNTFLAYFFEVGLVGSCISIYLLISVYRNLGEVNRRVFELFLCLVLFASPNNHLLNNDLLGVIVFASLSYFVVKVKRDSHEK